MTNTSLRPENRFPRCLRMELDLSLIQQKGIIERIRQTKLEQIYLILNIHFGEHQEEIHYGSGNVTFGIKRGELRIKLINGEVPLKNIKLKDEFPTVIETEIQKELERERQSGVKVVFKNPDITAGSKITKKEVEKIKNKEYQVRTGGGKVDEPIWVFEAKTDKAILEGLIQDTKLTTIDVKSKPCHLIATFIVKNTQDICITNGELLWSKNIIKKRSKIIERGLARLFLNEILNQKSYLSRQELVHE